MKKNIKFLLLTFFMLFNVNNFGFCQLKQNKAQKEYLDNLAIIQDCTYKGEKVSMEVFNNAILFLETITGIKSDYSYGREVFATPSKKNIKDWMKWFKKNKKLLYYDELEQKVKVKGRKLS